MILDFHTHIFPEKIARPTIDKLKSCLKAAGEDDSAYTDGTVKSLIESMKKSGIDRSVILPVVTNPKQFESINRFSASFNGKDGLISFGGIHPDNENPEEKLDEIKKSGMKGIKLHPDYQNFYVDEEKSVRIIRHCLKIGLIVVIHAGFDPISPNDVHCTPERVLKLLDEVKAENNNSPLIVLAHLGGYKEYSESYEKLCGQNIYFDTSYVLDKFSPEKIKDIFLKHGTDKILFATDSPWGNQETFVNVMKNLRLSDDDKEKILYKNALHLLALNL